MKNMFHIPILVVLLGCFQLTNAVSFVNKADKVLRCVLQQGKSASANVPFTHAINELLPIYDEEVSIKSGEWTITCWDNYDTDTIRSDSFFLNNTDRIIAKRDEKTRKLLLEKESSTAGRPLPSIPTPKEYTIKTYKTEHIPPEPPARKPKEEKRPSKPSGEEVRKQWEIIQAKAKKQAGKTAEVAEPTLEVAIKDAIKKEYEKKTVDEIRKAIVQKGLIAGSKWEIEVLVLKELLQAKNPHESKKLEESSASEWGTKSSFFNLPPTTQVPATQEKTQYKFKKDLPQGEFKPSPPQDDSDYQKQIQERRKAIGEGE